MKISSLPGPYRYEAVNETMGQSFVYIQEGACVRVPPWQQITSNDVSSVLGTTSLSHQLALTEIRCLTLPKRNLITQVKLGLGESLADRCVSREEYLHGEDQTPREVQGV